MDFASAFNFITEFGCAFVLLRCLSRFLNYLGMLLMFVFCLKVLRFGWYSKGAIRFLCNSGGVPRFRLCLENLITEVSQSKVEPLEKGHDRNANVFLENSSSVAGEKVNEKLEDGSEGKEENNEREVHEDEVFDVMALRKLVKIHRQKANVACAELEEERTAAASSAEEAMAMILRLQSEKSSSEIEATQFRRMAEEKLEYDEEVIESLQWTITQHQSQRSILEDQLGIYKEQLKQFIKDDEINQMEAEVTSGFECECECDCDCECDPDKSVVSSPEAESQNF